MKGNFPGRAVHLDFHTMPGIYDIGEEFSGAEFARTLAGAGVDYITVFAKCNLGFAYYPTKIGAVYPGLKKDLLGLMVRECHKKGIKVAAYFNAGLDHELALRRREWCKVNPRGQVYEIQHLGGHSFRQMCLNTGYREHLLSMVGEVLEKYPVDGIFLDCISFSPCHGAECLEGMKMAGMDCLEESHAKEYCWEMTKEFKEKTRKFIGGRRRGIYMYFNGMPYRQQPTHLELEVLPTGGWGYDYLHWAIRYARTLGKPYFTMTGRFHKSWGDFGGIRPFHSLMFDCWNSVANGGTCSVGDHMHPRGRLEPDVYELIGRVYSEVRKVEPWTLGSVPVSEIVIIDPSLERPRILSPYGSSSLAGASRMLMELNCQFDAADRDADLSGYKVIVLPDEAAVDEAFGKKLEKCIKAGASVISSCRAGLNPARTGFTLKEHWPVYLGEEPHTPSFFKASGAAGAGLPNMPITIYDPGISMRKRRGARLLARLYSPYSNRGAWDGFHNYLYNPPDRDTGRPALVRTGNVFHFSFPVFGGYYEHAVPQYRVIVGNCLREALSRPVLKMDNFPSFGQATVQKGKNCRMVHLLSYLPELRGKMQVIEEPVSIRNAVIQLREDACRVTKVFLAPSMEELDFKKRDGYILAAVPEVNGHQLVVFQHGR